MTDWKAIAEAQNQVIDLLWDTYEEHVPYGSDQIESAQIEVEGLTLDKNAESVFDKEGDATTSRELIEWLWDTKRTCLVCHKRVVHGNNKWQIERAMQEHYRKEHGIEIDEE